MSTLGIIGSGRIGSTVAKLAVAAEYDVVLSNSRGPGSPHQGRGCPPTPRTGRSVKRCVSPFAAAPPSPKCSVHRKGRTPTVVPTLSHHARAGRSVLRSHWPSVMGVLAVSALLPLASPTSASSSAAPIVRYAAAAPDPVPSLGGLVEVTARLSGGGLAVNYPTKGRSCSDGRFSARVKLRGSPVAGTRA